MVSCSKSSVEGRSLMIGISDCCCIDEVFVLLDFLSHTLVKRCFARAFLTSAPKFYEIVRRNLVFDFRKRHFSALMAQRSIN